MGSSKRKPAVELTDWVAERDRQVAAKAFTRPTDKPLTKNHLRYMAAIRANPVTLAVGPAGTAKTTLACRVAVELLREGKVDQIVLTRPLVPCDEDLGTLPGTEPEKMAPYLAPLAKGLARYLGRAEYDKLVAAGTVRVCAWPSCGARRSTGPWSSPTRPRTAPPARCGCC